MYSIEDIIKEHSFFKELEPEYLELIAGCGKNVRFNAGDFLFREGDEAKYFYLIRHGTVSLSTFVPGRGPESLQTLGEEEVLGWSWLFSPYQSHFDAQALTLVRAVAFDGTCLRTKCNEDHHFGYELMQRFAHIIMQRLQATRMQILDVYGVKA